MKKLLVFSFALGLLLSSCNKDKARIAMTFNKGTAVYANIDEVRATPLIAPASTIENPGKIFIGDAFLLIGEEGKGIHVYDNTNPNSPVNTSFIQLPYSKEFFVKDNVLYAESHYDLLKINLSDIHNPTLIDRLEYAFADPITNSNGEVLVGFNYEVVTESFKLNSPEALELEKSYYLYYDYNSNMIPASSVPSSFAGTSESENGTLNKIAVHNNYIYVISSEKMHCFQNSATSMGYADSKYLQSNLETIYAEGNRLYIGTENSMIVMDVSNPSSPEEVSTYWHPNSCDPVLPHGNVAYLTLRTADFSGCSGDENSLEIVDITDVTNPVSLNSITMESPYGMAMINNHLFVGEGINGLSVFDATDPENLVLENKYDNIEAYDIIMHPTIAGRLLATNNGGLEQYQIDYNTMEISLLSHIGY